MKTRILYAITAILILTFSFVVYASIDNSKTGYKSDSCCAMKDCCKDGKCSMNNGGKCNCKGEESCSMMKKDGKCCDKADCCKDGKCSMSADGKCKCGGEHKCGEACKDSCPMHKKDGEKTAMKGDCCKGKDSCPMKQKDGNTSN